MQIISYIDYPSSKKIEVSHDKEKIIDKYSVPFEIKFCDELKVYLSLKDAERLCEQLGFAIEDYRVCVKD